ncbi:16S rRNA (cytosine(1402)-N(4))-methyltransferase RsmH [Acidiphilium acidophilum]|uniref:16S rRNA (cytosine(1402)-N(4))-methyltransferase RsmH n=1 Tax=Acidiphilium acidophilum TaxID=76588 RepID=UPI002E8E7281|nr:16S rRNA (cytosine(1402)-N(4))-methyltransferase RsmH [Acidiphilium acidophilum]
MSAQGHIPVLRDEAIAMLAPRDGGVYLDGTFGGGGYTEALLDAASCTVWAIDRDPAAIARGASLAARYGTRLHLLEGRFGDLLDLLKAERVAALDGAVFDFGVSSYQIDDPARGFSFRGDGPLDMRMSGAGETAAHIVNTRGEAELADILYQFGEERASRRIAAAIVARRTTQKFETTADLAGVIRSVVRPDKSGIHPATRSFQALRIEVNQELAEIERGLEQAAALLAPGGRLVAVSFHSLEDRMVKRFMQTATGRTAGPSRHDPSGIIPAAAARFAALTKGVITPGDAEIAANPRARSARLRAIERRAA